MTAKRIAASAGVGDQTVFGAVAELEKQGLIVRYSGRAPGRREGRQVNKYRMVQENPYAESAQPYVESEQPCSELDQGCASNAASVESESGHSLDTSREVDKQSAVVLRLEQAGFDEASAQRLAAETGATIERVEEVIRECDRQTARGVITNRLGWITSALRNGYSASHESGEHDRSQERQRHRARESEAFHRKTREHARHVDQQRSDVLEELANLPPERLAGYVQRAMDRVTPESCRAAEAMDDPIQHPGVRAYVWNSYRGDRARGGSGAGPPSAAESPGELGATDCTISA